MGFFLALSCLQIYAERYKSVTGDYFFPNTAIMFLDTHLIDTLHGRSLTVIDLVILQVLHADLHRSFCLRYTILANFDLSF